MAGKHMRRQKTHHGDNPMWSKLRWAARGVTSRDYRATCKRCKRTGQAHWSWKGCWRYKRG